MLTLRVFAAAVSTLALVGACSASPTEADAQVAPGQPTSWGVIVGRAEANDMRARIMDWQWLRKARALMQLNNVGQIVSEARQAQMMGTVDEHEAGPQADIFQKWSGWYKEFVIGPAARIAANP